MKYLLLILLIIFVYRLFSFASRFNSAIKNQQNKRGTSHQSNRKEGEVHVDYSVKKQNDKVVNKDEGDYVDFEELS